MDQEKCKAILAELDVLDDEIKKLTGDYNTTLEAMGKDFDTALDELTVKYEAKHTELKTEITGVAPEAPAEEAK